MHGVQDSSEGDGAQRSWAGGLVPPSTRLRNANLNRYIDQKLYWGRYASRQIGKTTLHITRLCEINALGATIRRLPDCGALPGDPGGRADPK